MLIIISGFFKTFGIFTNISEILTFISLHPFLEITIITIIINTILSNKITIYRNNFFIKEIIEKFLILWKKGDFADLSK